MSSADHCPVQHLPSVAQMLRPPNLEYNFVLCPHAVAAPGLAPLSTHRFQLWVLALFVPLLMVLGSLLRLHNHLLYTY